MTKIILFLFAVSAIANLYAHGGEKADSIDNQVIFASEEDFILKEIDVTNWDFSEKEIILNKDEKYRLVFKIESGHHGIGIRGLDLKSGNMRTGEQVTWDLQDLEEGEYRFFCNVPCGQGHSSMRGVLIVN